MSKNSLIRRRGRQTWARAAVAYCLSFIVMIPVLWLVVSSLRPNEDIFDIGLPHRFTLRNFDVALFHLPLLRFLLNSAIVSVAVTAVALLIHAMAGYALARWQFRGRSFLFAAMVSTMLISLTVVLVPLFLIVQKLNLVDSYLGLILPNIFNAYGIFLLRQYYLDFPRELEEAASIDGCGHVSQFFRIVLPYSRGILTALAVLFFLANWNAFLWPLTITRSQSLYVIQLGMASLQGQYSSDWGVILAMAVLAAIPTAVMFLLGQKHILEVLGGTGK